MVQYTVNDAETSTSEVIGVRSDGSKNTRNIPPTKVDKDKKQKTFDFSTNRHVIVMSTSGRSYLSIALDGPITPIDESKVKTAQQLDGT